MAKLTKHAEVITRIHALVKASAEAQSNISGAPGHDVRSSSVGAEHENVNKNAVKPENVAQGVTQKPSDDPSEALAGAKTAEDWGTEILDLLRKQSDAQDSVTGKPGDVVAESVKPEEHKEDKNSVKPENNKQKVEQEASTDASKPLASAKKAEDVAALTVKVASYELGRQFAASLLKSAGDRYGADEVTLMKEAGRRDFDALIAQASEGLENAKQAEKRAEAAGAEHFDTLLKQSALETALAENEAMAAKLAEYEAYVKQAADAQHFEQSQAQAEAAQEKLASTVAAMVLNQLKSTVVPA